MPVPAPTSVPGGGDSMLIVRTSLVVAMVPRRSCAQQRVELAVGFEFLQIVRAADVALADKNLRHGVPAAPVDHLGPAFGAGLEIDLLEFDALAVQKVARERAMRAPGIRVHLNLGCGHAYLGDIALSARAPSA